MKSDPGSQASPGIHGVVLTKWHADCAAVLDATGLEAALSRVSAATSQSTSLRAGRGVDLWSLLFSRTFSDLSESILRSSLERIRMEIVLRLGAIAGFISEKNVPQRGDRAGLGAACLKIQPKRKKLVLPSGKGVQGRSNPNLRAPLSCHGPLTGRPSYETAFAAEMVVDLLERKLEALALDSQSLVQHGDVVAANDLTMSRYLRVVEMVSYLFNHLRRTGDAIGKEALDALKVASAAKVDLAPAMISVSPGGSIHRGVHSSWYYETTKLGSKAASMTSATSNESVTTQDGIARHLDGLIVLARFACGIRSRDSILRTFLRVPDSMQLPSPDRVGIEQLQAAFIVTDNDGDGKLDAEEVRDAVNSVLACGHLFVVDEVKMPTVTFNEFALIATAMLENQMPFVHLAACLDEVVVRAYTAWAKAAVKRNKSSFAANLATLTARAKLKKVPRSAATATSTTASETPYTPRGLSLQEPPSVISGDFESMWRDENGSWAERAAAFLPNQLPCPHGTVDLPTHVPSISGALQRFLFTVASDLNDVMNASDFLPISYLDFLETHDADGSSPFVGAGGDGNGDGPSGTQRVKRVTEYLRQALSAEVLATVAEVYHDISTTIATMDNCTESCIVQLVVDATFVRTWMCNANDEVRLKLISIESNLRRWVDAVNMEILRPHLSTICKQFYDKNLAYLWCLRPVTTGYTSAASWADESAGCEIEESGKMNVAMLASKAPRFALLPVPLDFAIPLDTANGYPSPNGSDFQSGDNVRIAGQLRSPQGRLNRTDGGAGAFNLLNLNNLRFKW